MISIHPRGGQVRLVCCKAMHQWEKPMHWAPFSLQKRESAGGWSWNQTVWGTYTDCKLHTTLQH